MAVRRGSADSVAAEGGVDDDRVVVGVRRSVARVVVREERDGRASGGRVVVAARDALQDLVARGEPHRDACAVLFVDEHAAGLHVEPVPVLLGLDQKL